MSTAKYIINKEVLIDLVRRKPAIWDKTQDIYRDKQLRIAAWLDICNAMTDDFAEMNPTEKQEFKTNLMKTWSQTRDRFVRGMNLKKRRKFGSHSKPYMYHKQLLFLKNVIGRSSKRMVGDSDCGGDSDVEVEENIITEEIACSSSSDEQDATISSRNIEYSIDNPPDRKRKIKTELEEEQMPSFVNVPRYQANYSDLQEDRSLAFFKSIQPTLSLFDDDQILQFQSGVITLLQDIKRSGNSF